MRYRPPSNRWDVQFEVDYEQNLKDIEKDITGVQKQIDIAVVEGDSSPAADQARVDANGNVKSSLKTRLDDDYLEVTTQLTGMSEQKADQAYVDTKFGSMGNIKTFKGSCLFSALPTSGMSVDDYWYVTDKSTNYCYNGTSWVDIGNNLNIGEGTIQPKMMGFKSYPFVETAKLFNNVSTQGFYSDAVISISIVNADISKKYYVSDFWNNHAVNKNRCFTVKSSDGSIVYNFTGSASSTGIETIKVSHSNGSQLVAVINWGRVITQTSNYTFANTELSSIIARPKPEDGSIEFTKLAGKNTYDSTKVTDNSYIIGYNTTSFSPNIGSDPNRLVYTDTIPNNKIKLPYYPTMNNCTFLFGKAGIYDKVIGNSSLTTSTYVTLQSDNTSYVLDCIALIAEGYDTMKITFLKNNIPPYVKEYGVVPNDFTESTKGLIKNINPKKILLPSKIRIKVGTSFNIYLNNIIRFGDTYDFYRFYSTYPSYFIPRTKKHLEVSPQAVADYSWRLTAYDRNPLYGSITKNIDVKHVAANSGDNTTKKVMFLGDSMTNAAQYTQFVLDKFNAAAELMNIELIGTRGTGFNKHEGRSGWRAWEYVNLQTGEYGELINNPFFNPSTSKFDFSYYMSNNGFSGVDIVCINLGTNDVSRTNHNADSDITDSYTYMINSIKAYNPNVKILLWLPPVRAQFTYLSPEQKDTALRATELLINTFDNREGENIYLVPVYLNVDPENDYATTSLPLSNGSSKTYEYPSDIIHPATIGYQHIADVIYPYLKYVGGLS